MSFGGYWIFYLGKMKHWQFKWIQVRLKLGIKLIVKLVPLSEFFTLTNSQMGFRRLLKWDTHCRILKQRPPDSGWHYFQGLCVSTSLPVFPKPTYTPVFCSHNRNIAFLYCSVSGVVPRIVRHREIMLVGLGCDTLSRKHAAIIA